jgi:hypothetical protein
LSSPMSSYGSSMASSPYSSYPWVFFISYLSSHA